MLEMMPGSSLEKTNSNLTRLDYVPSNRSQQPSSESEKDFDIPKTSETQIKTNVIINKRTPPKNKPLSPKIEKKLIKLFQKYNISESVAKERFKHLKRFTKDKHKTNRVLACKLYRIYFKSSRPKWYDRGVSKKKIEKQESVRKNNERRELERRKKRHDNKSAICEENNSVSGNNTELSDNETAIEDFETDGDIRDKIKLQLELLRKIRKPTSRSNSENNEESNDKSETKTPGNVECDQEIIIENEENCQKTKTIVIGEIKATVSEHNSQDVNIEKEDDLEEKNIKIEENCPTKITEENKQNTQDVKIIIKDEYCEGIENAQEIKTKYNENSKETNSENKKYCSTKTTENVEICQNNTENIENCQEKKVVEPIIAKLSDVLISNESELSIISVVGGYISDEEPKAELPKNKNHIKRGTSIADILLRRELTSQDEEDVDDISHIIVPTKTRDITKIKGWRSKHFTVSNTESEEKSTVDEDATSNDPVCNNSSLEDPVASTSTAISLVEYKSQSQLDNILKQGENATETNTKSAFVSDKLDTFLTNHAELKISYEVPKLVAEETITKPVSVMPVEHEYLTVAATQKVPKPKYNKKNAVKPKTLAEKRRMLEMDRKKNLLRDMEINEEICIKRLEYCGKRNKTDDVKDIQESLLSSQTPVSRYCWKMATNLDQQSRQFAILDGHKIRLAGSCGGKPLIIKSKPKRTRMEFVATSKCCLLNKLSRSSLSQPDMKKESVKRPINYKAGPLSKKQKLMMKNGLTKDNWECHVLKMPTIKLLVYPEEGKPMPLVAQQYLQVCRSEEGHISEQWAQFAVSAVRCKEKKKTMIEFPLPYANHQNKLLVRKLGSVTEERVPPIYVDRFPHIDVANSIKEIMTDLLTCIENQELDKLIIKNDPDLDDLINKKEINGNFPAPSPIDSMVQAIIKRPNVRRSRTSMELKRLNVQVIEVDLKEDELKEIDECKNDYCHLGCICKSLRCLTSVPDHCGRVQCMLECSCAIVSNPRAHHSISLPAGTDILSASTVVRLQDEANRNLAKEERKFSQTVIKANNQTIVIGDGARERQRRISKVPKKYSNYIRTQQETSYHDMISTGLLYDDIDPDFDAGGLAKVKPKIPEPVIEVKKPIPIWIKDSDSDQSFEMDDFVVKDCTVKLQKLNLEHIVPWCMVHNLYKCHCNGKATSNKILIKAKSDADEKNITTDETTSSSPPSEEFISYAPRLSSRYQPKGSPTVTVMDITDSFCARTRALATNYYQARNKSQTFKTRYAKMREKEKHNDTTKLRQYLNESLKIYENSKKQQPAIDENRNIDALKRKICSNEDDKAQIKKFKSEEALNENSEPNSNDNPKEKCKGNPEDSANIVSAASFIDYDRSFQGILTPARQWLDKFQKMLHVSLGNAVVHQIRLLEWETLVSRQRSGKIQVWFSSKKLYNIVLTEDKRRPSRLHMNVRLFEKAPTANFQIPEIVSSLLNNKLPGVATSANETFVIIVKTGSFWEARGTIVLSNTSEMCKVRLADRPTPPYILVPNLQQYENNVKIKSPNVVIGKEDCAPGAMLIPIKITPGMPIEVAKTINSTPKVPPLHIKLPKITSTNAVPTIVIPLPKSPVTTALTNTVPTNTPPTNTAPKITISKNTTPKNTTPKNTAPKNTAPTNTALTTKASSEYTNVERKIQPFIISKQFVKIAPKPVEPANKMVEITKLPLAAELKTKQKTPETKSTKLGKRSENILVPLPTGLGLNRWFMMILENDFSVLRIAFSNFHIKYTHLTTAIQMARNNKKTVRIRSQDRSNGESAGNFGIYAVPSFSDKIFFGPYTNDAGHGLETFRFVNGKLVNTRIYNKWRATNDRKTRGIWFTHNSTLNNSLNLEPQFEDCDQPVDIATMETNHENAVKPQIEFVDLTGNDSDSDTESGKGKSNPAHVDQLFNVLSADFSKKVVGDFTIEPIFDAIPVVQSTSKSIDATLSLATESKRNPVIELAQKDKKKPVVIDNITLDVDDEDENSNSSNNQSNNNDSSSSSTKRQMPNLCPIVGLKTSSTEGLTKQITYVITNIPGIGYFEIFYKYNTYYLNFEYKNKPLQEFKSISAAVKWLYMACYKHMFFMQNLTVRFSILETTEVPDMPKFNAKYLNGTHVICKKGIFDLLRMTMDEINGLGFNETDTNTLITRKCNLLNKRKESTAENNSIEITSSIEEDAEVLKNAPDKIKNLQSIEYKLACEKSELIERQQELMASLSSLLKNVPEAYGIEMKKETLKIFKKRPRSNTNENKPETLKTLLEKPVKIPLGKYCRLVDGKVVIRSGSVEDKPVNATPSGAYCKIIDGKIIVMDKNTGNPNTEVSITKSPMQNKLVKKSATLHNQPRTDQFEMLVPIAGLESPVTVVGMPSSSEKSSSSLLKKSKIVDLTDD